MMSKLEVSKNERHAWVENNYVSTFRVVEAVGTEQASWSRTLWER